MVRLSIDMAREGRKRFTCLSLMTLPRVPPPLSTPFPPTRSLSVTHSLFNLTLIVKWKTVILHAQLARTASLSLNKLMDMALPSTKTKMRVVIIASSLPLPRNLINCYL